MTTYSIVVPVYNSERIVAETVRQIRSVATTASLKIEVILVNDGSSDGSWRVIRQLALEHEQVVAIDLLRNYGQHTAILAGFSYARGDYVVTMDDDLQNPPGEILTLIEAIHKQDADLVIGRFIEKKHPFHRQLGSRIVGYLNGKIFHKPKHITLSNFRIIRRDVIERVLAHKTVYPYITGMLQLYATKVANVTVAHDERQEGASNYNFIKIASLVSRLLLNYSSYPLRCISSAGLAVSVVSFLFGSYYFVVSIIRGGSGPGWTTLIVLLSFLCGFIIALLGLIGEYLSRILEQLSCNRSFIVREKTGEHLWKVSGLQHGSEIVAQEEHEHR